MQNCLLAAEKPRYVENSAGDDVVTYVRSDGKESVFVAVNLRSRRIVAELDKEYKGTELLSYGVEAAGKEIKLAPFGYAVIKI